MPVWLAVASKWGSIVVLVGLVIALMKALIGFVGFVTLALKILIVLLFVAVFAGVAFLVFRAWQSNAKRPD
ncbi:MAG: hypothetical protein KA956_07310 [Pyrinomonadaceae bacterium]|nr:hypothetical protein [Acidobacteriota bacterium]MBP7376269.1 hypothetical protein [Pyrinomonadaceae bacterium]